MVTKALFVLIFFVTNFAVFGSIFDQTTKSRCQPIDIPLCQDIPYNMTIFPNPFFPHDQQSLQSQAAHFKPLIKTKCNPHIKFFVCSVFAPMCPDQLPQAVTSCRSVCEEVKKDCIKILQEFDVQWPAPLNCSNFPEGPDLCMRPQDEPTFKPVEVHTSRSDGFQSTSLHPTCPVDLVDMDPTNQNQTCAFRCNKDTMFPRQAKLFIQKYAFLAACVGMAITGLTVLSFLVDIHRFRFPERSIFYIAACQLLYVVPYFARRFLNHEQMACNKIGLAERMILVDGGLDNSVCVVSAVFTHYFWTAGCLWWLMLTFTWYLSASRKWVQEEIEKRATYLHLISWGVAAFSTIFVLITQNVDANELTGICGVGFLHFETFVGVVVAPQLFILLFGLVFAILGFGSLRKQKQCFKHRGTDTSKLDKFITKMSLFTLIYVLTMVAVLIGDGYHAHILRKWYPATIGCKMNGGADRGMCRRPPQPEVVFYVVRTLSSILVGTTMCIWMFSTKTFKSWRDFLCCGSCHGPNTEKCQTTLMQTNLAQPQPLFTRNSNDSNRMPQRNPPALPQNNQYIPLSIMTNSGNSGGISVTYAANPDQWKASKVV